MLRLRLSISCRYALSQTRGKAWICLRPNLFNPSSLAHLRGTSRDGGLCLCSRQSFLIQISRSYYLVGSLPGESTGGHCRIITSAVSAALDGHPPDVHFVLLFDTSRFLDSPTL